MISASLFYFLVMSKFILFFFHSLIGMSFLCSQSLTTSVVAEINQTWFRQDVSLIGQRVKNPHKPAVGFKRGVLFQLKNERNWLFSISPNLVIYNTKSDVTTDHRATLLSLTASVGRNFSKKIGWQLGIEYAYLASFMMSSGSNRRDFTFFANHRSFINPFIQKNIKISDKLSASLNFTYFTKSLFNSGALDSNGEIVGPIPIYPFALSIGIGFKLFESSL